jgi:Uri superfamily endonuclease
MKGIYVLLVSIAKKISVRVGGLGDKSFQEGLYAYVGSAQNNLEKRVERHLRIVKRKFWHIDYLLGNREVEVLRVFYKKAGRLEECRIAERLGEIATPVRGFGSSDCKCKSHLFRIEAHDYLSEFMREIGVKPLAG